MPEPLKLGVRKWAVFINFPGIVSMAGAVAGYLTGRKNKSARDWLVLAVTVVELLGALLLLYFPGATLRLDGICGLGLTFQADGFRMVMALLTAAVWMMTTLPS